MNKDRVHLNDNLSKIVIESVTGEYLPPHLGQEMRQRLTMNCGVGVTFTRYFFDVDFSKVSPIDRPDKGVTKRYRNRETTEILDIPELWLFDGGMD